MDGDESNRRRCPFHPRRRYPETDQVSVERHVANMNSQVREIPMRLQMMWLLVHWRTVTMMMCWRYSSTEGRITIRLPDRQD